MFTTTHHEEHPISTALDPTSAAPAEPAGPSASVVGGSTAPAVAPKPPVAVGDLTATVLVLIFGVVVDAAVTLVALLLAIALPSCGQDLCMQDPTTLGWIWAMIAPTVVLLVAIILSIVRLVKRRRAWWVAAVGLVSVLVVWGIGVGVMFAAAGTSA